MRPIKLTMSAFGPYAGETVIEFDKLGENGIYLITGDTGAGKTTIFDAIVFALYSEASGKNRKSSMFRSKYAKPETPTFVELIFKYGDKEYKVRRNPDYERPKTRGEGFTEQKAGCELTYPDGRVLTKKNETDGAIKEIIGITRKQFLQIAMIAQGDFLKLLLSSTDERKNIFRHIFKTEKFCELQNQLKAENSKARDLVDKAHHSMKQYIDGIVCTENSTSFSEIEKAKNNELPILEVMLAIEKLIQDDENSDKELTSQIAEIEKQLAVVNSNLGKLEEQVKAKQDLASVNKNLEVKTENLAQLKELLEIEREKLKDAETLNKEIAEIKAELPRYDELESQQKKLDTTSRKLKADEKSLFETTTLLVSQKEILIKLKDEKSSLEKAGEQKEKLANEKSKAEDKKSKLEKLKLSLNEYNSLLLTLEEKQKLYLDAMSVAENALNDYNEKNTAFLNEQAGILAEQLKENSPCPVCGSTSHPCLGKKSDKAPTELQLKKAKQKSDEAQNFASEASNECSVFKGKTLTAKSNIEKQLEELVGNSDIDSAEEKISRLTAQQAEVIKKLKGDIAQEERKIRRKSELEEIIPNTEIQAEKLKTDISSLDSSIASHKATLEEIAKQLEMIKSNLCFADKKTAERKQIELESKAEILKKSFEKAQNDFNACDKEVIALKARAEQLRKQLESATEINADEVTAKQAELSAQKKSKTDAKTKVLTRLSVNCQILENVRKKSDEINVLEKNYTLIKSLSDTANGNITGKERVMLETYIQMTYFDRIIARANTRFMVMSGGQYEMKRRQESDNKKSQGGLDIDVIDHYNGTQRSVNTLSGGESFKASLSLALGLSDEIQASAGGIRLDTMFVDEGFGSLDEESLNQAMNALKGLTDGNRLVGIISHVNELKERIDKQIVVKKDKLGGSYAKIIT